MPRFSGHVFECCFIWPMTLLNVSCPRTQAAITLSSAKGELCSATSTLCAALLLQRDVLFFITGNEVLIGIYRDNVAAKQILR